MVLTRLLRRQKILSCYSAKKRRKKDASPLPPGGWARAPAASLPAFDADMPSSRQRKRRSGPSRALSSGRQIVERRQECATVVRTNAKTWQDTWRTPNPRQRAGRRADEGGRGCGRVDCRTPACVCAFSGLGRHIRRAHARSPTRRSPNRHSAPFRTCLLMGPPGRHDATIPMLVSIAPIHS